MNAGELVAAALTGRGGWPSVDGLEEAVLAAAEAHGVAALLAETPATATWPAPLRERLRAARRREAALDACRRRELARVLEALDSAGAAPVLIKGAHLAHTLYRQPWLRSRIDTDVIVPPEARGAAARALARCGYGPATGFGGTLVTHQAEYSREDRVGLTHHVDVHWRIANPQVFAGALTWEELRASSVAVPALGVSARGPSVVHALLIACVHRVAHHRNSRRLVWLLDIRLLAGAATPADQASLTALAIDRGVGYVCAHSLAEASAAFGDPPPAGWIAALSVNAARERAAAFADGRHAPLDVLRSDLAALPLPARLRLLREHLFPPAAYMRRSRHAAGGGSLARAYVTRAAKGAVRWMAGRRATD